MVLLKWNIIIICITKSVEWETHGFFFCLMCLLSLCLLPKLQPWFPLANQVFPHSLVTAWVVTTKWAVASNFLLQKQHCRHTQAVRLEIHLPTFYWITRWSSYLYCTLFLWLIEGKLNQWNCCHKMKFNWVLRALFTSIHLRRVYVLHTICYFVHKSMMDVISYPESTIKDLMATVKLAVVGFLGFHTSPCECIYACNQSESNKVWPFCHILRCKHA